MSLDPNHSPERDPKNSGASPKRPQLLVHELDPIAVKISLENLDRLTDVLHLCGLTPNSDTIEYVWKTLLRNELATVEDILEHRGPLGVSLELDLVTKHEIECRNDLNPEEGGYEDRVSVIMSTRHREGSEVGALLNLSEGCPGLEGLFLELQATPLGDTPAIAHIYWSAEELADTNAGERWDLLRGFFMHFRDSDLPQFVSLTAGQQDKFHYLSVDLDPMIVRVQRLTEHREDPNHPHYSASSLETAPHVLELRLEQPPLHVLERILSITETLQVEGPWVGDQSKREILDHLRELLYSPRKLDIDALKVCAGASPCIIFSRENSCDGDVFPPQVNSRVTMTDYTCAGGEFQLEFLSSPEEHGQEVICRWYKGRPRFTDIPWHEVHNLARPYLIESSED
jgi:hypothetical protein